MSESVIDEQRKTHMALANEIASTAENTRLHVKKLKSKILNHELDTEEGISLLEIKNHQMLEYLSNLSYVMLKKCTGKKLENDEAIVRLVTNRTVLEKVRPIEQKLKYQINKALKVADTKEIKEDDPMYFKPNPNALANKLDDDDDEDNSDSEEGSDKDDEVKDTSKKPTGKYVAPKHIPTFFDDDTNREEREKEAESRKKKQILSRGLINELKSQHLDTPEEIHHHEDVMKKRHIQAMKDRIEFEEDNFIRLPVSKKTKHNRRQMSTMGTIADEITSFGFNSFTGSNNKRKRSGKGVKKSSARKRFKK